MLSHAMEDGKVRPIAYVSHTLTPAEKKYSQLEEGLAIVFGVKRFHLWSAFFQHLFSEHRGIPQMAIARPMLSHAGQWEAAR